MTPSPSALCPQCGAAIPEASEHGLCPRCVFAKVLQPTAEAGNPSPTPPEIDAVRAAFSSLEVIELIGSGGMGSVFKARQSQLDRFVALKILPTALAEQPGFSERFQREAQALAKLNHPHIVTVHDFGQAGGFFYLLMEFVDGVNLRQLLQTKKLTPKEALSIVPPVCDALQCAHDHGIVHRDIKPENLLIDKAGIVKIADFGIAKIVGCEAGTISCDEPAQTSVSASLPFGTPDYAAPEQANGTADHRADIYSLGVVLYEMLTGERPTGKIEAPSKRVQVDLRIDELVLRALEKTPELRFATAAEFRTQVEEVAKEATTSAPLQSKSEAAGFAPDHLFPPWLRLLLGAAFVILLLNFAAPHVTRLGNNTESTFTIGLSGPWLAVYPQYIDQFRMVRAVKWNFRTSAFLSGVIAAVIACVLISGRPDSRLRRWLPKLLTERMRSRRPRAPILLGRLALLGILLATVAMAVAIATPAGLRHAVVIPIGVSGNIVNVDVVTHVGRGNAELLAELSGPKLPAEITSKQVPGVINPTPRTGSTPWQALPSGINKTRLRFALPTRELAQQAFDNLRPLNKENDASGGLRFAGLFFEVSSPRGDTYRARLQIGPLLTAARPEWTNVYVSQFRSEESTCHLSFDIHASQSGTVSLSHDSNRPFVQLQRLADSNLFGTTLRLELLKVSDDRVTLIRQFGGAISRTDLVGSFEELAEQLRKTKQLSVRIERGTEIELCELQGKPISLRVELDGPLSGASTRPLASPISVGLTAFALVIFVAISLLVIFRPNMRVASAWGVVLLPALLAGLALIAWKSSRSFVPLGTRPPLAGIQAFPTGSHISRNHHSVVVTHDRAATTLHHVLYSAGDSSTTASGSQNHAASTWVDEGTVKLRNGRAFGYRREALTPDELRINGTAYDLRKGRVIFLEDDGTTAQFRLFPELAVARDPDAIARLIASEEVAAGSRSAMAFTITRAEVPPGTHDLVVRVHRAWSRDESLGIETSLHVVAGSSADPAKRMPKNGPWSTATNKQVEPDPEGLTLVWTLPQEIPAQALNDAVAAITGSFESTSEGRRSRPSLVLHGELPFKLAAIPHPDGWECHLFVRAMSRSLPVADARNDAASPAAKEQDSQPASAFVQSYAVDFAFTGSRKDADWLDGFRAVTEHALRKAFPEATHLPEFTLNSESKRLNVKATPEEHRIIARMIAGMKGVAEVPSGKDESFVRSYSLDFTNNGSVATLEYADLRDLLEQVRQLGGDSQVSLHVGRRALIVKSTRDQLQGIDELVEAMRKKASPDPAVRHNPQLDR